MAAAFLQVYDRWNTTIDRGRCVQPQHADAACPALKRWPTPVSYTYISSLWLRHRSGLCRLNRWLNAVVLVKPPPAPVRYMKQLAGRPPTFALFVGRRLLPPAWIKFLQQQLRAEFGLGGVPVRLIQRQVRRAPPCRCSALPLGGSTLNSSTTVLLPDCRAIGSTGRGIDRIRRSRVGRLAGVRVAAEVRAGAGGDRN